VKKQQNGRKSLRRLKPTVGCNASKRRDIHTTEQYILYSRPTMVASLERASFNLFPPEGRGTSNLRNVVDVLNLIGWATTKISVTIMTIYRHQNHLTDLHSSPTHYETVHKQITNRQEHQTRTGKSGLLQIKCLTFHILDIMNIVEIILRNCCITDDIHMRPHTA
jgi:hypothetical protein